MITHEETQNEANAVAQSHAARHSYLHKDLTRVIDHLCTACQLSVYRLREKALPTKYSLLHNCKILFFFFPGSRVGSTEGSIY